MNQGNQTISSEREILSFIESSTEGRRINEVDEIQLKNIVSAQFGEEFRTKLASFPSLNCLGLNSIEFSSIEALPQLPRLLRLEICYCVFDLSSISAIAWKFPRLVSLRLVGCNIVSLTQIEPLRELQDLAQIDLFGNPVYKLDSSYASFHDTMFKSFRKLIYLDNLKKDAVRPCTIPPSQIDPAALVWDISPPPPKKVQSKTPSSHLGNQNYSNQQNQMNGNFMRKNRKLNDSPENHGETASFARNRKGKVDDGEDYDDGRYPNNEAVNAQQAGGGYANSFDNRTQQNYSRQQKHFA